MRVLVTGATGFIGTHLVGHLVRDGATVDALILPGTDPSALVALGAAVTIHVLDGTYAQLETIARESRPDVAIHLASLFLASHEPSDVGPLVESNILFGTRLVEAMLGAGVTRFVNAGTSWQHDEKGAYNPVCLYAATKQAFEDVLAYYRDAHGLRVVTLKLFDTYGPGDQRPKVVPLLVRLAREPGAATDFSPGDQLIDLVHVRDVAAAFGLAAGRTALLAAGAAEDFAVSSGHPVPLRELVGLFEKVLGRSLGIRWGARPHRFREVLRPWLTGRILPGWNPAVGPEEGFGELLGLGPS